MPDSFGDRNQKIFSADGASNDADDLTYLSERIADLGTRRSGTSSERSALPSVDVFDGLDFWETNTKRGYRVVSGAWAVWDEWTGWLNLPGLSSNFATDDGAAYARATRGGERVVKLRGQITRRTGNVGPSEGLFTLTDGNRPPYQMYLTVATVPGVNVRLSIATSGLVSVAGIQSGQTITYVRLDGIIIPIN